MSYVDAFHRMTTLVLVFSGLLIAPLWSPHALFWRIKPTEQWHLAPRFQLQDSFALMVYLALANLRLVGFKARLEFDYLANPESLDSVVGIMLVVGNLLVFGIWVLGLGWLQRFEIVEPRHRLLFQGVLYPLAVLWPGAISSSALSLLIGYEQFDTHLREGRWNDISNPCAQVAYATILLALLGAACARWQFQRIASAAVDEVLDGAASRRE